MCTFVCIFIYLHELKYHYIARPDVQAKGSIQMDHQGAILWRTGTALLQSNVIGIMMGRAMIELNWMLDRKAG